MNKVDLRFSLLFVFSTVALVFTKPINASVALFSTNPGSWYINLSAGVAQPKIPSVLLIDNGSDFDPPNNRDRYSTHWPNSAMISAVVGRLWQRTEQFIPGYALGLRYQHVFTKDITGQVMQYSVPEFTNYEYNLGVLINTLSAYSKVELVRLGPVIPYINGGLGVSVNNSETYVEMSLPGITPRNSPAYAGKTRTQFTYDLGLGIDVVINPELMLTLGYEYQNFGKLITGAAQPSSWATQRLDLGTLNTNTFTVGLNLLLDKNERSVTT